MSAVVTVLGDLGQLRRTVEVPKANGYDVNADGHLVLRTTHYGEKIAQFKRWDEVVITPDRGSDGRFVKRGS